MFSKYKEAIVKSFVEAEEVREFPKGRLELVRFGEIKHR